MNKPMFLRIAAVVFSASLLTVYVACNRSPEPEAAPPVEDRAPADAIPDPPEDPGTEAADPGEAGTTQPATKPTFIHSSKSGPIELLEPQKQVLPGSKSGEFKILPDPDRKFMPSSKSAPMEMFQVPIAEQPDQPDQPNQPGEPEQVDPQPSPDPSK